MFDKFYSFYYCDEQLNITKDYCVYFHRLTRMTMISESSFISTSSKQTLESFNNDMHRIEADLFNKVVSLKNQKIRLLGLLSDSIDKKHHSQNQLLHQLEIKKRKQQNLATKTEYEPIIYRNVELKAQEEQLTRQILEKTSKTSHPVFESSRVVTKSRAKSDIQLSRGKELNRSNHSKNLFSKPNLNGANQRDYDDDLIDQIIEQRKANNSLAQIIREENNNKLEISISQEMNAIKQKIAMLEKLVDEKQMKEERLSRSIQSKRSSGNKSRRDRTLSDAINQEDATPITNGKSLKIKELLAYIQEEEEQKRLLYEDLIPLQEDMQHMREQNEAIKTQLASKSVNISQRA